MWLAAMRMKSHSAPGDDGILSDFYKSMLVERNAIREWAKKEEGPSPPAFMTDALLSVMQQVWQLGTVPDDCWVDSIIVSLPKKGDPTDTGNYRGISLMSTALKIICIILSNHINTSAEVASRFSTSQAGFCHLEECVTQAACLVEALKRHHIVGLETFGLFIDLKKAYDDMVPHEALFAKLRRFGIRGRAYDYNCRPLPQKHHPRLPWTRLWRCLHRAVQPVTWHAPRLPTVLCPF